MQPVNHRQYRKSRGHIETGVALIVAGLIFLSIKLGIFHFDWQWYSILATIFVFMGLVEFVQFNRPHKVFEGFTKIALGIWFYVAFSGTWGINPANSWPLILILVGAGMVVKSLFKTKPSVHDDSNDE